VLVLFVVFKLDTKITLLVDHKFSVLTLNLWIRVRISGSVILCCVVMVIVLCCSVM